MGDRIVVLHGGELQQVGTPIECYHQPKNLFVAGFIGSPSMNFLDATRESETVLSIEDGAFEYRLSDHSLDRIGEADRDLVLGIRPEDIELVSEPVDHSISVRAEVVEPLGEVSYLYFDIEGTTYTASVDGTIPLREGTTLEIAFPEDRIHLFDATTGETVKHRRFSEEDRAAWMGARAETETSA